MLYKGDKGVNDAAHPPEGGSAETRGLLTSNLPLNIDRPARVPDNPLKSLYLFLPTTVTNQADICLRLPSDRTRHKVNEPKVDYSVV